MDTVVGLIKILRYECPICGEDALFLSHCVPKNFRCRGCNFRMSRVESPYEEESIISISLLVGDEIEVIAIEEQI